MTTGLRLWKLAGAVAGVLLAAAVAAIVARGGKTPEAVPLLPDSGGALDEIVMHWSPTAEAIVSQTYEDFWQALPETTRLSLIVPDDLSGAERNRIAQLVHTANSGLSEGLRWIPTPGPITPWSKDRALVAPADDGSTVLWVPPAPGSSWKARENDWHSVEFFARSTLRVDREPAPFEFDAGDFMVTERHVIVSAHLIEKNRRLGIDSASSLRTRIEAWLGRPVLVLGSRPEDVPRHHLSMMLTTLDSSTALVGDPAAAARTVGEDFALNARSSDGKRELRPDFSAETQSRFDRLAVDLERAGYDVHRIVNVPIDEKTYVAYTNGVFETRGTEKTAYMPRYDYGALDRAAQETYRRLGWKVKPIRVRRVFAYHGTIGCLVNVISRRAS